MRARVYNSSTERQRAYRARKRAARAMQPVAPTPKPGYYYWRKDLQAAQDTIARISEEIGDWMQDRSERWQESDRGAAMEADHASLEEISNALDDLGIWRKG